MTDQVPYIALARKWRPARFRDVVGQTSVIRTLMNSIRQNSIQPAYLFTGSRGIGKTSIARIFAKALRCEKTFEQNGSLESCDVCSQCLEISAGQGVDVIEIDGASNNGVDAIREIRENVKYTPSSGTRKIYIIDEVHMLTTAAFNALLKTLEEPPPHVLFIFATTEPHKIPGTVLSRVQRFDFQRVTPPLIQARLELILNSEKVTYEHGAIALVAHAADGGMRDALSLLDQVIAYAGQHLTVQSVRDSLGLIPTQSVLKVLTALVERKPLAAVEVTQELYQHGHDLRIFIKSLIEATYALILIQVGAKSRPDLQFSPEDWIQIEALSQLRTLEEMELIFQVLNFGTESLSRSSQPRFTLDILLIKCAAAEALVEIGQAQPTPTLPAKPNLQLARSANPVLSPASGSSINSSLNSPALSLVTPPQPVSTPKTWEGFVEWVKIQRPLLASFLEHVISHQLPTDASPQLILTFRGDETYKAQQVQTKAYWEPLNEFARNFFGSKTWVKVTTESTGGLSESLAERRTREQFESDQSARDAVKNHPAIKEARTLFGVDLTSIELTRERHHDT